MTHFDIFWITFEQEHEIIRLLGYGSEQQLPVLLERADEKQNGQSRNHSFTMDNIILGMLHALGQKEGPLDEMVDFNKTRAVQALRHLASENGDPGCEHMFRFATNYMRNNHMHADVSLMAYVACTWFGMPQYNMVMN